MPLILILSLLGSVCLTVFAADGLSRLWVMPLSFIGGVIALSLLYWAVLGLFSLKISLKKEYAKPSRFYLFMLNAAYWFVCTAGRVKLHITGMEMIPQDRRFLFVSNHLSRFDPMIQSLVLRKTPLSFITKPENFKIPIGRRFMNRSCYIAIDRESPRNAAKSISRAAELIISDSASIGVYPEGTRSTDGKLGEFKAGCLKTATKSGCPIVVSTILGTEKIRQRAPWRRTHVYLDILEVIGTENVKKTAELSENIHSIMQRNIEKAKGDRT